MPILALPPTTITSTVVTAKLWAQIRTDEGDHAMTKEELTAWASANGWRSIAGHLSLAKPRAPNEPIVRLLLKATVATLEIRKPAGKWEKIASSAYAKVTPGVEDGLPQGLGFEGVPSLTMLMQDNRDQMVFARIGG